MRSGFLIYGSTGFVGREITQYAIRRGLQPIISGRNADKVKAQAQDLGLDYRVFELNDPAAMDKALGEVTAVLHCAGPFIHTSKQMAAGCLRTGTHYLDITGEIPVYAALAKLDEKAQNAGVMILPGVGFDIVPSDCLALHLKQRLPTASRLTLAFFNDGPAGLPPGTAQTMVEMAKYGTKIRVDGKLKSAPPGLKTKMVDFGGGPRETVRLSWGDVFMAYYSTGIVNIEDYTAITEEFKKDLRLAEFLRPLFFFASFRNRVKRNFSIGSSEAERALTRTIVWGEVEDDQGRKAVSRLIGPEAGVVWTAMNAVFSVEKVLEEKSLPGFQTPGRVFGADFVLEGRSVTREDILE